MINSRDGLIAYCMKSLGAPVLQINVDESQVEDRIDDAIQKFWEFHGEGSQKMYFVYTLTAEDITNQYIKLPPDIINVLQVRMLDNNWFRSLEYQAYITDVLNIRGIANRGGIGGWEVAQSYMSLLQDYFNRAKLFMFNKFVHRLHIMTDWSQFKEGSKVGFEAYAILSPEDHIDLYNNIWLKKYATALVKRQWGQNMLKYDGFQLPAGMVLNGGRMFEDANAEIEKLEEELYTTYQLPIGIVVG